MVTDTNGYITNVNKAFTEVTGYTAEEALGEKTKILSSGYHTADFYQSMWDELDKKHYWQGDIWNKRKNGEVYHEWLTISAIEGDEGEIIKYVGIFSDISNEEPSVN